MVALVGVVLVSLGMPPILGIPSAVIVGKALAVLGIALALWAWLHKSRQGLPPMPSFDEQIGDRPALLIHVKLKSAGEAETLAAQVYEQILETLWEAKEVVERIGGQVLGSRRERGQCTLYLCAKDTKEPGPDRLLAAIEPLLRKRIPAGEWRVERRYAADRNNSDNSMGTALSEPADVRPPD